MASDKGRRRAYDSHLIFFLGHSFDHFVSFPVLYLGRFRKMMIKRLQQIVWFMVGCDKTKGRPILFSMAKIGYVLRSAFLFVRLYLPHCA